LGSHIERIGIILNERRGISIIYGILLFIGIALCIGALIFIPVRTYTENDEVKTYELVPSDVSLMNNYVREYHFRDVNWEKYGTCLHFLSSHQEIQVTADNMLIFERTAAQTLWGRTPGFSWEYVTIPEGAKNVTVTVKPCYASVRDYQMTFYQGYSVQMLQNVFREEGFIAIVNFLNLCLGLLLLLFGTMAHKRSNIGGVMVYLGIFMILLSVWSISENGIVALLLEQRAACSFISYTVLIMVGIPFIMFVRCYLGTEDNYLHKILLGLNVVNIIVTYALQLSGLADMKQTLTATHIVMVASFIYLPISLVHMFRKRIINRRFWVSVCSLCSLCPPLAFSLYQYYSDAHEVDSYGDVFFFIFIAIFAADVCISVMRDVDAGKKAAIYQELAEKDTLTGCYNRNAYGNDADHWGDLNGVLLVTCDLNNLKQCNDTLGHTYGDQYIMDSAAILKKIFSPYGKVYRIGGDEFCIIIPDGKKCNIERLLAAMLEEERAYNADSPVIHLQIACGCAEYDAKTDSNMEDIRIRADEKMYENKKALKKAGNVA
jgi:diguanylate cyclase (GGDEF)-like protein